MGLFHRSLFIHIGLLVGLFSHMYDVWRITPAKITPPPSVMGLLNWPLFIYRGLFIGLFSQVCDFSQMNLEKILPPTSASMGMLSLHTSSNAPYSIKVPYTLYSHILLKFPTLSILSGVNGHFFVAGVFRCTITAYCNMIYQSTLYSIYWFYMLPKY